MADMTQTTKANKTDQLNADDFISGPMNVKVTAVKIKPKDEQPAIVSFEGDGGKPFKPCLSMRRVLVEIWGGEGDNWVGQSMTLYNKKDVTNKGQVTGGIRISHMTGITKKTYVTITVRRGQREPWAVEPLVIATPATADPQPEMSKDELKGWEDQIAAAQTKEALNGVADNLKEMNYSNGPVKSQLMKTFGERKKELSK
jgi:hypothetical protein